MNKTTTNTTIIAVQLQGEEAKAAVRQALYQAEADADAIYKQWLQEMAKWNKLPFNCNGQNLYPEAWKARRAVWNAWVAACDKSSALQSLLENLEATTNG